MVRKGGRRGSGGFENEKKTHLRAVGAGPGVGHREDARARVLESEVLVGELLSVDRLAAGAVACRKKRGERGRVRGEFHA